MKQSYKEILVYINPSSYLSLADNKFAALLVYLLQGLPLTANKITFFSFFLVLIAAPLLFINFKILFILFLFFSYTCDNIDGIWARLKKQTSEFGKFFDPFMDKVKDFVIDLSFFIFYYSNLTEHITSSKVLLLLISFYFICKGLFYITRDYEPLKNSIITEKRTIGLLRYGEAEKILIVCPARVFSFTFFIFYTTGYCLVYFIGIFTNLYKIFSKDINSH